MRITALATIYAGGKVYAPGDTFEHDEAEAKQLIAGGFAAPAAHSETPGEKTSEAGRSSSEDPASLKKSKK